MIRQELKLQIGWEVDTETGKCTKAAKCNMSTLLFYRVCQGDMIQLQNQTYQYRYVFYSLERPEEYIYTYSYQEEQQWTTYEKRCPESGWLQKDAMIDQEGYIRIQVMRQDGRELEPHEANAGCILLETDYKEEKAVQDYLKSDEIQKELARTIRTVAERRNRDSLVFTLLTDTHYVVNGNWEYTAATIEEVNRNIHPDGIIHLGDLTDGSLDKELCKEYSQRVLKRMESWDIPLYLTIGNHDTNYFRNNIDRLSEEEQYEYYLSQTKQADQHLWYRVDNTEHKLCMLFLHSFDAAKKLRYGFPLEEVEWVKQQLEQLPQEYQVILFSHDAPLARLDYWASEIRNGELLTSVLEEWHRGHENRIMAFIHGHTHADYIYREREFPIISIGCSKCEYFADKKPEGATTYHRLMGTVLQELWDTMIVKPKERTIEFVRFGSGMDRCIDLKDEKETTHMQIWAHRGASGYAPENTLEAFALAHEMGADGIELDVQLTRDRQLVVIHDETIDRTSNGTGYVADHTLEELKAFLFNKLHPEYEQAAIPTLREVLELVKPTNMVVNIELKTGVNFYEGIEERVLGLVEEMDMQERIIYSSFNHYSIMRIKQLCPSAKTGFLYCDGIYRPADYAERYHVDALHPSLNNMQYPQLIEQCQDQGIKLHVWTVNDKNSMYRLKEAGIDAVITNYPDAAYEVVHGKRKEALSLKKIKEQNKKEEVKAERKNILLHGLGVGYSKVRKVFVEIDRIVQKAAGNDKI